MLRTVPAPTSTRPIAPAAVPRRPDPLLYTIEECAALLSLSRRAIYRALASGKLGSVLVSARTRRVTRAQLEAYVTHLERESA